MGYYIDGPIHGKGEYIVKRYGAEKISRPDSFKSIPAGKGLVIAMDKGLFEAAGFIYDSAEFRRFTDPSDPRPKSYYLMDLELVKNLTGYKGN